MKRILILLCLPLLFTTCKKEEDNTPASVQGCTDPLATNYNPAATINDGSCVYITGNDSTQTYIPDDNFEAYLENNGMGNGISNDNYVTTANINLVTNLSIWGENIADLIGIEDFTSLDTLDCSYNQLTSLDISHNSLLIYLKCDANQITNLDVHNNINLQILLTSINDLTSLDVTENLALIELGCLNNQITSLDISQNVSLNWFDCRNNELTYLDLRNGNNHNMNLAATHNLNLICINVDDVTWATANWLVSLNIDPQHYFSEQCP